MILSWLQNGDVDVDVEKNVKVLEAWRHFFVDFFEPIFVNPKRFVVSFIHLQMYIDFGPFWGLK